MYFSYLIIFCYSNSFLHSQKYKLIIEALDRAQRNNEVNELHNGPHEQYTDQSRRENVKILTPALYILLFPCSRLWMKLSKS